MLRYANKVRWFAVALASTIASPVGSGTGAAGEAASHAVNPVSSSAPLLQTDPLWPPVQLAQRRSNRRPSYTGSGSTRRSSPALTHDLDARLQGGYDSNPLKLNSNVTGAVFGRLDLDYRLTYRYAQRQRLFIGGEYSGRRYDVEEADRDKGEFEIGFRDSSLKLGGNRVESTLGVRYGFRAMTFVDQTTGEEETSGGTPIGSRFDADWYELFGDFRTDVTKSTTLTLDTFAKIKNYRDDFTELGLDRLDYNEYGVEPGLRHKFGNGLRGRIKLPVKARIYKDRRAEDSAGNDIAGSDLKYYYFGVDAYIGDLDSRSARWRVGIDGERRLDNESGFGDRSYYGVYGRATFGRRDRQRFSVYVKASRREYDELDTADIDENNDGGRVRQGVRASLTYTHPVALTSKIGVDLYLRGSGEVYDNSDQDYEYLRYTVSAGLRKKF